MEVRTRGKDTDPLGAIGSLRVGFEVVGRHLWLIILPVLLDLFLWLGPRLSAAPLFKRLAAYLVAQPMPDPTMAPQVEQAVQLLEQTGERFNLFALLAAVPLLDVPSLLARRVPEMMTPLGESPELLITGVLALMAWVAVLIPAGPVLGFVYLNSLARRVRAARIAEGKNKVGAAGRVFETSSVTRKLISMFLFITGLLMAGMLLAPLWSLMVGIVLMVAPPIGFLVWILSVAFGGYLALHLMFVVHGVLLGERGLFRATVESFMLIQTQFSSAVALVLLVLVIYEGLGFIWSLPSDGSWTLVVGILGNGCIATGLTAATFVFYQERIGQIPQLGRVSTGD